MLMRLKISVYVSQFQVETFIQFFFLPLGRIVTNSNKYTLHTHVWAPLQFTTICIWNNLNFSFDRTTHEINENKTVGNESKTKITQGNRLYNCKYMREHVCCIKNNNNFPIGFGSSTLIALCHLLRLHIPVSFFISAVYLYTAYNWSRSMNKCVLLNKPKVEKRR